jgi:hypothetical protein
VIVHGGTIAMTTGITGTACVGTTGSRAPSVDASWTVRVQNARVHYPWKEKHPSTYLGGFLPSTPCIF